MTTISAVIERLRRTWLEPPDYQPAGTLLQSSINAGATQLTFNTFMVPEDEQLVRVGSIIELESELFRIVGYEEATRTATVHPEQYGTVEAAHSAGTFIRLSPTWPRLSIFEAVADSIVTMYPSLFTVGVTETITVSRNVAPVNDDLAVDVLTVWPEGWVGTENIGGKIVEFHPQVGGRALLTSYGSGDLWVRFTRRFGTATAETDTLSDLGVDDRWINIVMAGAAADLFVGRDLPTSLTEWVGAALQAENIPVGTRYQIANGLRSYRDRLLKDASKEMQSEYQPTVHMRSPFE